MKQLFFGADSHVDLPDEVVVADCGEPGRKPIENVQDAVRKAIQNPREYPDLASMTIPEDRVAIVLEEGQVKAAEIVAAIVNELTTTDISPENICVLRSKADAAHSKASPLRCLPEPMRSRITCVAHDPADRESLSYLGVTSDDSSIYINRQIFDADVVIPVGTIRHDESLGYAGVHGVVVPFFSDEETIAKFLNPKSTLSESEKQKRRNETREIGHLLGIRMTVQVIPGQGDEVLDVVAGDASVVEEFGRQTFEEEWSFSLPRRASLVVAGLAGSKQQQTWDNLARTVHTAMGLVESDGAIAICSELSARPGSALRKIVGADSLEKAERVIHKNGSTDALAATQLVKAMQNVKVYLLSKLDEEFVEDLGVAYISHPDEVNRLASRHNSCIAIENAQRVVATVTEG